MTTKIEITRHNGGNPVHVGYVVVAADIRDDIGDWINEAGGMADLLGMAEDGSTVPDDYELTGDECYEVINVDRITFYVIRSGWNAANQSALGGCRNPRNKFESRQYKLVGICDADSAESAIAQVGANCYNGQSVFAVTNPRSVKGLTAKVAAEMVNYA